MAQYTVAQGDNLSKIASQNNTTVQNLASLNNIQDVNKINVGQKLNLSAVAPVANAPIALDNITGPVPQQFKVTQPQVSTGSTLLQSDIISKGQADTARAVAEEARIAQQQGSKAPTATENVLKNILGQSSTTASQTQSTAPAGDAINVNGITSDTMASQRQGIQDTLSNITGETRLTANEYAGTVDPAKAELNAINARMNDEALAGRRRIESILKTPGVTKESAGDMINEIQRTNASTLADLAVVQMAKQGAYDGAKEIADRAVQTKVEDQKNKLNALTFTYTENKELFTKAEQRQFEIAQGDRKRKLDAEEKNLQRISDLSLQALQDGAPTSVVTKMRSAKTESEAIALGGQYVGRLDREVKLANIAQSRASIRASEASVRKIDSEIEAGKPIDVKSLVQNVNAPSETKNNAVMLALIQSKKIGEGAKTSLSSIMGVNKALEDLAKDRQYKPFAGISPFNAIADIKIPWTNVGIPFRQAGMRKEAVQNRGYLDAVNLKVQQWASGASLTEQQIEQVNTLTPKATDTDEKVRTKMNNLTNFMNQQISGTLASQGIDYIPEKVNLFENRELYNKASPEQKAELDKIINQ